MLGLLFVSSRIILRRTLYDLYTPYFSPDVVVKFTRRATGHFVMLTESCLDLITVFTRISSASETKKVNKRRTPDANSKGNLFSLNMMFFISK